MASVIAEGMLDGKRRKVLITGNKAGVDIQTDDLYVLVILKDFIENARGEMANAYVPSPNSIHQAYLACLYYFGNDAVRVKGTIEPIECEEGVIY